MSDYPATPEHDKITETDNEFIQRVQMLFEDLEDKGYALQHISSNERLTTDRAGHLKLLLEFFGVDYAAWLDEKDAVLAHIRDQREEKST